MPVEERTKPAYRIVNRESDISELIPGDRVKVLIEHGRPPKWMVYGGQKPAGLRPSTKCTFIEVPEACQGENIGSFSAWESYVRYLQFDGQILFNSFHREFRTVPRETEEYRLMKQLADMSVHF